MMDYAMRVVWNEMVQVLLAQLLPLIS